MKAADEGLCSSQDDIMMPMSTLHQGTLPNPAGSLQPRKVKKHAIALYVLWNAFKTHWRKKKKKTSEREDNNVWVINNMF